MVVVPENDICRVFVALRRPFAKWPQYEDKEQYPHHQQAPAVSEMPEIIVVHRGCSKAFAF
jgi:hypothetical protein